jgi:hypothetical protein
MAKEPPGPVAVNALLAAPLGSRSLFWFSYRNFYRFFNIAGEQIALLGRLPASRRGRISRPLG